MHVRTRRIIQALVVAALFITLFITLLPPARAEGGAALRFFGTGSGDVDRVKIPLTGANQAINVGATDFTIEFWMRARANENPSPACAPGNDTWIYGNILLDRDIFGNGDYGDYGVSIAGGRIAFGTHNGTTGNTICSTTNVADDAWHHVALTRRFADGQLSIFVDGRLDAQGRGPTGDISYRLSREIAYPNEPFLVIGSEKHDYDRLVYPSYSGWLDELRYSSGLRYTADFMLPNQPFATDESTLALYHFDEGSGTVAADAAVSPLGPNDGTLLIGGPSAGPLWSNDTPWPAAPATATATTPAILTTATPEETPTSTLEPTAAGSLEPTATSTLEPTATNSPVPTATSTLEPTATSTPEPTATSTNTPEPSSTNTPEPTATSTLEPTATNSPLPTSTNTPEPTSTNTPEPTATSTFEPTATSTSEPTATSTSTATQTTTPTATPAVLDVIFVDGFEGGNVNAWSGSATNGGDLAVTTSAALSGARGLAANINDNNTLYVTDDRPAAEPRYRARFLFDPNSISMANGNAHYIFYGYTGTSTIVFRVELRRSSNLYQLRIALRNNSNTWTNGAWITISDAPNTIEVDWRAATGGTAGGLTLWIDGAERSQIGGIINDTLRIDRIRLGPVAGLDSGTRGIYYFDAFESRRTTYIGPVSDTTPTVTPAPSSTSTPAAPTSTPTAAPSATSTPTAMPTATRTVTPTATPTAPAAGNSALSFNGSTSVATAAINPLATPFTVEGWIRPAANGNNGIILSTGNDNSGWSVELNGGRATFWVATTAGWRNVQNTTSLQAGRWYHIAVTYSGSSARVFVDGAASSAATINGAIAGSGMRFGAAPGYAAFNGAADEFRLSNIIRYSAAFTRPLPPYTIDENTVALWRFDEGSGQTVADASGNGNALTLGSSASTDAADPAWVAGAAP
jgi:cell division septation protein DedD